MHTFTCLFIPWHISHSAPLASLYLHPNCYITLHHIATYPPYLCYSMIQRPMHHIIYIMLLCLCSWHHHPTTHMRLQSSTMVFVAHHVHHHHLLTLPSCMRHLECGATSCMCNASVIAPHPIISATYHEHTNAIHSPCIRAIHHAHFHLAFIPWHIRHSAPLAVLYLHPNCYMTHLNT